MLDFYDRIAGLERSNVPFVVVTIVRKEGHGPQVAGAKMCVTITDGIFGTIGGGAVEHLAIEEARKLIGMSGESFTRDYLLDEDRKVVDDVRTGMLCGGKVSLFYDVHGGLENLYVFGGGHIGKALWHILRGLGYYARFFDSRKEVSAEGSLADANLTVGNYDEIMRDTGFRKDSYFVIATHSHELDYQILRSLYMSGIPVKYVGVIASRKKCDTIMQRLVGECGRRVEFLARLYCPIGLNIGGPSPAEIAVSITAELQAVKYGKPGSHLTKDWRTEGK